MDKLKDFIKENNKAFDELQLPEGHRERFEKKLSAHRRRPVARYALWGIAVAACLGLLFTINIPQQQDVEPNFCDLMSTERDELLLYYNMQMNKVVAQMEILYEKHNNPGSMELLEQTNMIRQNCYHFEEVVLPTLPCSENGLFVMNQHYGKSVEGMTILLQQMQRVVRE